MACFWVIVSISSHCRPINFETFYSTFSAKTTKLADYISSILFIWLQIFIYIYKLAIICSIAHKILVAMVTTFENTSLATAKPAILWQNFQLQSCVKSNSKQLCNWRFFSRSYSFQDKKYHRIDFYWILMLLYLKNYCF